ncbi:hypothetical protein [Caulobacter sp. FWC2]|uniref:hypothetical protein n=1 Tax=Caulobacter sp. FWC2 TaxID=69664 RepID=UPI001177D045|nr:hypothetical protein [Caulobacter sp. FWC2]
MLWYSEWQAVSKADAINAMLAELGGKKVADGNVGEKVKTQKAILRDFLEGDQRPAQGCALRRVRPPAQVGQIPDVALTAIPTLPSWRPNEGRGGPWPAPNPWSHASPRVAGRGGFVARPGERPLSPSAF